MKIRDVKYIKGEFINFHDGYVITKPQELIDGFRWGGQLPKVVPANSTPAFTGGLGPDAWILVDKEMALKAGVWK